MREQQGAEIMLIRAAGPPRSANPGDLTCPSLPALAPKPGPVTRTPFSSQLSISFQLSVPVRERETTCMRLWRSNALVYARASAHTHTCTWIFARLDARVCAPLHSGVGSSLLRAARVHQGSIGNGVMSWWRDVTFFALYANLLLCSN